MRRHGAVRKLHGPLDSEIQRSGARVRNRGLLWNTGSQKCSRVSGGSKSRLQGEMLLAKDSIMKTELNVLFRFCFHRREIRLRRICRS